jgi:hypothetical protein
MTSRCLRFTPAQLTASEDADLKSQSVTSSWGGARRAPALRFHRAWRDMLYKDLQSPWAAFRGKEDANARSD